MAKPKSSTIFLTSCSKHTLCLLFVGFPVRDKYNGPMGNFYCQSGREIFKEAEDLHLCWWTGMQLQMLVRLMSFVTVLKHASLSPQRFTTNVSSEANRGWLPWHFLPKVTEWGSPLSHFLRFTVILFQWHVFYLMKRRNKHFIVLLLKTIKLSSLDSLKIVTILKKIKN